MPYLFLIHERRFGFMLGGHFKVAMKTIWLLLLPALMLAPMAILAAIAEPPAAPDALKYGTVKEQVIEARLEQYEGNNQRREATKARYHARANHAQADGQRD